MSPFSKVQMSPFAEGWMSRGSDERGTAGLVSHRRGQPSHRRISDDVRGQVLALVREHYADFGPTLAAEYLSERHGFRYSAETLRGWMIADGLWRPKPVRRTRVHPPRERRPRFGELVQVDGSPHDWFEGRGPRCCLIGFIDDATSALLFARVVPVESTRAYLAVMADYVNRFGVPAACYSDRHSIFRKHNPEDMVPTQFERALYELGCEPIQATSPQAKGGIERVFQTLQDHLVKAMRLAGISDIAAANGFLQTYLPGHNARFAVAPRDAEDAHRPWIAAPEVLSRICALHHERTLSKNLVLSFQGQRYIVLLEPAHPRYALRRKTILVCEHLNGRIELLNGVESLPYRVFDYRRDRAPAADDKTLNERVDQAIKRRTATPWKPPQNHPWRRYSAITGQPSAART